MTAVTVLLEKLLEDRTADVSDAGRAILERLSDGQIDVSSFLEDPSQLTTPPFFVPRYLAQITLRALRSEYDTIDELAGRLQAFLDRNAPTLEPRGSHAGEPALIPEARVIEIRQPARREGGQWESGIVATVTSGPLRGQDVDIRISSTENRTACFLVSCLWMHAAVAAYNLEPASESEGENIFVARPDTFFVIEPLRQVNVTSIARSLHCTKPQTDQVRRGKGDTTIQTLRGTIVHAVFDRMLEGARDLEGVYGELLPQYAVQLASIVDEFFDEEAFRSEVLRHLFALQAFIDANRQVLEDPQIELKRYSATLGIQGRIDAMFRRDHYLDILELKTGTRIRAEDHAQLFIYRLLLSDLVRRWQRGTGASVDISARLLSSTDGAYTPLQIQTDFQQVMDARNRLVAAHYALSQPTPHFKLRYEGFNEDICRACTSWVRERCKVNTVIFGDRPAAPGSDEPPELTYFRKFTSLVERERWAAEQDLVELLDDSLLEARRKNFRCLTGTRLIEDAEPFTFEFNDNTSDFGPGDSVLIHAGNISSTAIFHGHVRALEAHRIRISIPLKNLSSSVFAGQQWTIDRYPSDVTSEASHTALYDYLTGGSHAQAGPLRWSGQDPDPFPGDRSRGPRAPAADAASRTSRGQAPAIPEGFNDSQRRAIQRAVTCSRYHLVWGPPGTGKTKVIPEIVRRVEGRVLLGAFTNTAVDKMLMALLAADPGVRFLRIGRSSDSPELAAMLADPADYFSEDLARKHPTIHAVRQAMDAAPVVAATAHRACTMPYLRRRAFEMAVVDEAGQLTEPLTLGLILRARRFVLIGDDRQLPPVVRTRELGQSMFERLKHQAEQERAATLTLLDTQYRMHPQIMAVSNKLFYEGRLRTGVSAEDRLPPDGGPLLMIPVDAQSEGRTNEAEAEAIEKLVHRYLKEFGVAADAIGVVSPFRAQVVLLRKRLEDTGVAVDTVERFQGGERDIMILSLVRSEGGGFVFDERRLNVAITRARRKLVLVAHPELFRNSKYEWLAGFAGVS